MENRFQDVMRQRSNAELLEIVTKQRGDYEEEALLAAEAELKQRDLTPPQTEQAQEEIKTKEVEKRERANEPLGVGWKIVLFLFPGVVALMIAGALKAQGYHRKHKDVWTYTLYGVAFYVVIVALGSAVDRLSHR